MIFPLRIAGPLGLLAAVALAACGVAETGRDPVDENGSKTDLYYPLGIAAHPDGRYLFVANAVFNRYYNAGTLTVYDTFERRFLPEVATDIGLFAGDLVAARGLEGDAEDDVALFVATRDDSQLWRVAVESPGGRVTGLDAQPARYVGENDLGREPYSIAVDADGRSLTLTHGARGAVTRWGTHRQLWTPELDGGGKPKPLDPPVRCELEVFEGATVVTRHPVNGWWYVSDRFSQFIKMVAEVPLLDAELPEGDDDETPEDARERLERQALLRSCRLFPASSGVFRVEPINEDSRSMGMAFSQDGGLLYVASYAVGFSGGAIRVFDTTVLGSGRPANRLVKAIGLGTRPNMVRVAGCRPDRCPAGTDPASVQAKGQGLVYVTAFHSDQLFVIDPGSLSVVAKVPMPDGPHDIVFMLDGAGHLRGYVTNFNDDSLSILDLEPGSPTRFTVTAKIKSPPPPEDDE